MDATESFYLLELGILTYLCQTFTKLHDDKPAEEQIRLLEMENWLCHLDESTKGEQYSDWLLQDFPLEKFKDVCHHILECRFQLALLQEPLPDVSELKKILDVYARHYVNTSLTAQFLCFSLLCDFD